MSEHILSISEAQRELTRLPEQFEEGPEAVTVTRYGKPVMTILPYNTYKSLLEAIEALQETIANLVTEGFQISAVTMTNGLKISSSVCVSYSTRIKKMRL